MPYTQVNGRPMNLRNAAVGASASARMVPRHALEPLPHSDRFNQACTILSCP